jgi:predicted DNA-binding transcriptional regulator AlpA
MQRFITIKTWAKLSGMKRESAYKRLKSGRLEYSPYCEMPAIDIYEFPPTRTKCVAAPPPVKRDLPEWCYDN